MSNQFNKNRTKLTSRLAFDAEDISLVQCLRAKTFSHAFGVIFENGIDQDHFDLYCTHLMVFDGDRLVATTRLLDRNRAILAGGFYSEQEFNLQEILQATAGNILEIGRTCVAADYPSILAIQKLWHGVAEVASLWNVETLIGCLSLPTDLGDWQAWLDQLPATTQLKVDVKAYIETPSQTKLINTPDIPNLLKTYIRMNAYLGAQAYFDQVFNSADILIWLPLSQLSPQYRQRFISG